MKNNGKLKVSDLARLVSTLELMGAQYYTAKVHAVDNATKQRIETQVVMGLVFRASNGKYMFTLGEALRCPAITPDQAKN